LAVVTTMRTEYLPDVHALRGNPLVASMLTCTLTSDHAKADIPETRLRMRVPMVTWTDTRLLA